jgi:hypothetical protein
MQSKGKKPRRRRANDGGLTGVERREPAEHVRMVHEESQGVTEPRGSARSCAWRAAAWSGPGDQHVLAPPGLDAEIRDRREEGPGAAGLKPVVQFYADGVHVR